MAPLAERIGSRSQGFDNLSLLYSGNQSSEPTAAGRD